MANIALSSQRLEEFKAGEDDQALFNEVVATLNDLGHYNRLTGKYQLNLNDHSACLRDLIRFLRNDGPAFLVRRQMGISNIVDNDLIPIIEQHTINDKCQITERGKVIMDKIIRLLLDLTNATILHYPNQIIPKDDKFEMNTYLELQNYLFQYKQAFSTRKRFWIVLSKFLTQILELNPDDRSVEDDLLLERIIIVIRNVLHIPILLKGKECLDSPVHDQIIEHMSNSGLLDIFQYMISSEEYAQYCFHLLEILYLIYRDQNAEFLANDHDVPLDKQQTLSQRSQYEREWDQKKFIETSNRDKQEYLQTLEKIKGDDYTRFRETAFVIKNIKSVSDRDMICYRAYSNIEKAIDFNKNKITQRRAKNRQPMKESVGNNNPRIHFSSRKIRLILYDFCAKFLSESFNNFMVEIRSNIIRGKAHEHDETYYLWACQFFLEFNRYQTNITREQKYQQVNEILSTSTFHFIQSTVENYMDHLSQKREFKNEISNWSKRLHRALKAYRELLFSLSYISNLNLPATTKICFLIKSDIFIEPEYREMLLNLMLSYNELTMSKAYLRDLIETNHVFLRMLEYHAKISLDFKIKIRKRKRNKHSEKLSKENDNDKIDNLKAHKITDLPPEEIWLEIINEIDQALNSKLDAETILDVDLLKNLFDPLGDIKDQQVSILRKINQFLKEKEVNKAVALYREARNVFSGIDQDNAFGENDIEIDDEMIALNGIIMSEFPPEKSKKKEKNNQEVNLATDENSMEIQEKAFSFDDTLMRYAHPNTVRVCRLLLSHYRTNSSTTNNAIVKLCHRIAVNLKMKPMFYNLGYFILFEQIMDDPILKHPVNKNCPYYKSVVEIERFARFIIKNFLKLIAKHSKIASEICFLANCRDAYQMEYGFEREVVHQKLLEKKGLCWSEEQQLELEVLYNEYKDQITPEKDLIDLIQEHLIDDTKTRRQIINQLRKMDLLKKEDMRKNSNAVWTNEELEELKALYEKFKDNIELETKKASAKTITTNIEEVTFNDDQELSEKISNELFSENDKQQELDENENKRNHKNDIIDCILRQLSTSAKRNRRQIIRQLKMMNIYDHSKIKKWTQEQIEELRSLFCNLYMNFKQCQKIGEVETIAQENEINKENFMEILMDKFTDKTKTIRQILKQLKRMEFWEALKKIGIVKEKPQSNKFNANIEENDEESESDDENLFEYHDDDFLKDIPNLNQDIENILDNLSIDNEDTNLDIYEDESEDEEELLNKKKKRKLIVIDDNDEDDNDIDDIYANLSINFLDP